LNFNLKLQVEVLKIVNSKFYILLSSQHNFITVLIIIIIRRGKDG
jgi:hypothetical protein